MVSKTPRTDAKRLQDSPDAGVDGLARGATVKWDFSVSPPVVIDTQEQWDDYQMRMQRTDMPAPPAPWQESAWNDGFEPVERQTWFDWRGVVIGCIAVAVFCAVWVAIP